MRIKKYYLFFGFLAFLILFVLINFDYVRNQTRGYLPAKVKIYFKELFFGKEFMDQIAFLRRNNYNQKFLPNTQFQKISFKKINIKNLKISETSDYDLMKKKK